MPRLTKSPATVPPIELADVPVIDDVATADTPPPAPVSPDAARHVAEQRDLERVCEELFAKAADGHFLTADERGLLKRLCPDAAVPVRFEKWLTKQVSRIKSIREMQGVCGTAAERQAAADTLASAEARRADEGPAIEKQIVELRARLGELDAGVADARNDCDRRERARLALCQNHLLPGHVQEEIRVLKQSTAEERGEFARCQNRVAAITVMEKWRIYDVDHKGPDYDAAWNYAFETRTPLGAWLLDQAFPLVEPYQHHNHNERKFSAAGWEQHLQTLRAERDQCLEVLTRLRGIDERVSAEAARLREYLVPA